MTTRLAPGSTAVLQPDAPTERRIANDSEAYTYKQFAMHYGSESGWKWDRAIIYDSQLGELQDSASVPQPDAEPAVDGHPSDAVHVAGAAQPSAAPAPTDAAVLTQAASGSATVSQPSADSAVAVHPSAADDVAGASRPSASPPQLASIATTIFL